MVLNSRNFYTPRNTRMPQTIPSVDQGKEFVTQMDFNLLSLVPSQFVVYKLSAAAGIEATLGIDTIIVLKRKA